jgi:hypothetical protein
MKTISILGSIVGIILCIFAIHSLKPSSDIAFFLFSVWLSVPFLGALILSITHTNKFGVCIGLYSSLAIGSYLFFEVTSEGDAQGAIAIFILPIVLSPIVALSSEYINAKKYNK